MGRPVISIEEAGFYIEICNSAPKRCQFCTDASGVPP